jgi:hypothetical protein
MRQVTAPRARALAELRRAGEMVEQRSRPGGDFDGWDGREVLCHLAAYARLIGAAVRAEAEHRQPTSTELYGRELSPTELAASSLDEINAAIQREYAGLGYSEALALWRTMHQEVARQVARLSDEQLAAPGPAYPPAWSRPRLIEVVDALVSHYAAHMGPGPSDEGAPGGDYPGRHGR